MKFLCLPGAYGSAKNFKVQLGPFAAECEKTGVVDFAWTQGTVPAKPPPGFEDYFGPGPLFRFVEFDGMEGFEDLVEKIRDFPEGISAEDTMRRLFGDQGSGYNEVNLRNCLNHLFDVIDADREIEGILGYSEGATTAASLVLEERRRAEEYGIARRIKAAIFLAGWPPLKIEDGKVRGLLADECDDVIDIPTCHVVGCYDPYIHGAMALFNLCDEDSAELFDHGKGHTVPRDAITLRELGEAIMRLTGRVDN
ncbi:serine hydrolase FSH [Macrophomina phaseolina]|uniref:Serine hydrolase FSH n=1 Tax=Macrophomina phaseolina TaxID=35725 RepID=A0ABQ8G7E4_9PEZI|nr:serine hydrolase FSH [Macrophomina phaseolina]